MVQDQDNYTSENSLLTYFDHVHSHLDRKPFGLQDEDENDQNITNNKKPQDKDSEEDTCLPDESTSTSGKPRKKHKKHRPSKSKEEGDWQKDLVGKKVHGIDFNEGRNEKFLERRRKEIKLRLREKKAKLRNGEFHAPIYEIRQFHARKRNRLEGRFA